MKFGDDWTGVFLRGDNAFYYTRVLDQAIREGAALDPFTRGALEGLRDLLASSREGGDEYVEGEVQNMKSWSECVTKG